MIRRLCFLLCGIALTWLCAGIGLFFIGWGRGCGRPGIHAAVWRVREVEQGLSWYVVEHHRCPASAAELIGTRDLKAKDLVDPWGKAMAYSCSDDDVRVVSAGPDGKFNTPDDVTAP